MFTPYAWLIPVFPLSAFLLLIAFGRSFRTAGALIGSAGSLASFMMALLVLFERLKPGAVDYSSSYGWINLGGFSLRIGFEVTNMTALLLAAAALIVWTVHLLAHAGRRDDDRTTVFYGYLSLFGFALQGLLLSNNMLTLFMFWELLGACSFLLIGYGYAREDARDAARRAYLYSRAGSAAMLLAMALWFWAMPDRTLDFAGMHNVLQSQPGTIAPGRITLTAILLFAGGAVQAALFPLHGWLTAAAAARDGRTVPSAARVLTHTVVLAAAGFYPIARAYDLFQASGAAAQTVAYAGALAALAGSIAALVQSRPEKLLASIAAGQMGFAFMALGAGSPSGGLFHLLAYLPAMTLALLGAEAPAAKAARWFAAAGLLSLAGFPPFAGYWSLSSVMAEALNGSPILFAAGLAGQLLAALALARYYFVFVGGAAASPASGPDKRASSVTTACMAVYALLSVAAGFMQTPWNGWLARWSSGGSIAFGAGAFGAGACAAVIGLLLGAYLYGRKRSPSAVRETEPPEREPCLDRLGRKLLIVPAKAIGTALQAFDDYIIGRRYW